MPQVFPDKIVFDSEDFINGLAAGFNSGGVLTIGPGAAYMQNFTPFSASGIIGAASPGPNPTDATTVSQAAALLTGGAVFRQGTTYLYAGAGTKIHQIDCTTDPHTFTSDVNYPITISAHAGHGAVTIFDTVLSTIGTTTHCFVSWDDVNDGDVARFAPGGGAPGTQGTFMSTIAAGGAALTGGVPHPLIVGDDAMLYVGHGYKVGQFDGQNGANGTFVANAIDLPTDFIITSFCKDSTRNLLVIYAYRPGGATKTAIPDSQAQFRGESYAFFWDYVSPSFLMAVNLDDNYVNGGFVYHGLPGCFTYGRGYNAANTAATKLRLFNGRIFETMANANTNPPGHGGVEIYGDTVMWNGGGSIWQWGPISPGFPAKTFQNTAGSGTSSGGLLRNTTLNQIYASTGTTTSGGLQRVGPNNYHSTASWESLTVEPLMGVHRKCEVVAVKTYFAGTATGGRSLALQLITDKGGTTTTVFTGVTDITASSAESATSKQMITEAINGDNSGFMGPVFSDMKLKAAWSTGSGATSAPQIKRVEIYYKPYSI